MDGLSLITTTFFSTTNTSTVTPIFLTRRLRTPNYGRNSRFLVLASKDDPKLNQWDLMELKFGKLLGEDPKLTLAKIMGKKLNPDASYIEIEKSFHKKKGKFGSNDIEEIPLDWSKKGQSSDSLNAMNLVRPVVKKGQSSDSLNGLNLVRPVPKKGVKFEVNDKTNSLEMKKPKQSVGDAMENAKRSVPNVILRKPTVYNEDGEEIENSSKLRIKPNLSLRMGNEQEREKFSDMTLLRRPQQMNASTNDVEEEDEAKLVVGVELKMQKEESRDTGSDLPLLKKPEAVSINTNLDEIQRPSGTTEAVTVDEYEKNSLRGVSVYGDIADATTNSYEEFLESGDGSFSTEVKLEDDSVIGSQPLEQSNMGFTENEIALNESSDVYMVNSKDKFNMEVALQGKPKRLDQSVKETSNSTRVGKVLGNLESYVNAELENFLATPPLKESEDIDWRRAEDQAKTGGREEVELISCSTRGFVVSFGSLIGFLPYRNLAANWKFLAFESWLRMKGLDPATYRQGLGIIGSYGAANKNTALDSIVGPKSDRKSGELSLDMKLEELLSIYDQEKIKFLSSFVGQRVKVNVLIADRKSRKLIFSIRPKEKEESVEKKRSLMAKLGIGDVVKCCITKITYFGIFVEVEGVPALIHQTEVSWDTTLDPASYYKIGQIVEAKVHQLDFALERIFLSLKEITPDPLIEALESVVGDPSSLDERLQAAEPDAEWADVESLIKELQQIDGIQSVSKGRFFLSPGLAPTFQVYMASMFENQYKLLARSEKKVQEVGPFHDPPEHSFACCILDMVIVQTSLGKEEMKSAILTCTSRVE